MNILKKLGGLLWGGERQDLVEIRGTFSQRDPKSGVLRGVYPRGKALITRSATPHVSSLIVAPAEEQGGEEDPDEVAEMHFFIAPQMRLSSLEDQDGGGFGWQDSDGRHFFFAPDEDVSPPTRQLFLLTLLQAMYEWEHRTPADDVPDELLLPYLVAPTNPQATPSASSPSPSASPSPSPSPSPFSTPQSTPSKSPASSSSRPAEAQTPASPFIPGKRGRPVFSPRPASKEGLRQVLIVYAHLFWFDPLQGLYELCFPSEVVVEILQKSPSLVYYFHVHEAKEEAEGEGETYTFQLLSSEMNPVFYHAKPLTMTYGTTDAGGKVYSWGLKVTHVDQERSLVTSFGRAITEAQREESFSKMKEDEQRFLLSSFAADEEMEDAPGAVSSDEESEAEEEEEYQYTRTANKDKNSQLAISYNHQKSFVVRGSQIGVFDIGPDSLAYNTSIKDLKTPEGSLFSPAKTMLHTQDSAMLLLNPAKDNFLYKMDLNYGKIVEEWKIDDHTSLKTFCPGSKYAQKTPEQTLVGMSHNSIFLIDPRLPGSKQVREMTKQYARESRNDFSSTATTDHGDLVVVSNKGDIRLFNHIAKNAKTHLPGFGDPILGVDVTADGKWVLATCKNYLIVINTELKESGSTGFAKPMGQNKPIPKKLQLRSEHIAAMGSQPSFTPARFNVGEGEETTIVTSTGPYVVTWNFRRIKAGHYYDYKIKKYPDVIVSDNFRFGQHQSIVVALPDDVTLVQKSKLSRPQQASDLKSQIVNSPF